MIMLIITVTTTTVIIIITITVAIVMMVMVLVLVVLVVVKRYDNNNYKKNSNETNTDNNNDKNDHANTDFKKYFYIQQQQRTKFPFIQNIYSSSGGTKQRLNKHEATNATRETSVDRDSVIRGRHDRIFRSLSAEKGGKMPRKRRGLRTYMAAMIISFFSFLSFALSLLGETGGKGVNEVANKAATDVEKRDSVKQNLMVELETIRLTLTEDRDHGAENQTWCRY